jgi:hypothetical protein
MLSDHELVDRLRSELEPLLPPPDLIDRLRAQAAAPHQHDRRRLRRVRDLHGQLRRPARVLPLAISILLAVGIGAGALVLLHHRATPSAPGQQTPAARSTLILAGDGLGGVRFGASPKRLRELLDPLLGSPTRYPADISCGVDSELGWPILLNPRTGRLERSQELTLTFDHGRFVGYQYADGGATQRRDSQHLRPRAMTARGLAIGDSLATGERLYGRAFHISAAQGGSWQARTPQGTLRGYAYDTSKHSVTSPSNLVASIDGGNVGCPAMSP